MPQSIPYLSVEIPIFIFEVFEKYDSDKNGLTTKEILKIAEDAGESKDEAKTTVASFMAADKNADKKLTCHEMLGDWLHYEKNNGWPRAKWVEKPDE